MTKSLEYKKKLNAKVSLIVDTLVERVLNFYPELNKTKEWEALTEDEKTRVKRDMFYVQYGKTVQEYKSDLFNQLLKENEQS
jgi:hypothetical protein